MYENMTPVYIGIGICITLLIVLTTLFGFIGFLLALICIGAGIIGWIAEGKKMEREDQRIRQLEEENQRLREEKWKNHR
jgi:predicted membrane protein